MCDVSAAAAAGAHHGVIPIYGMLRRQNVGIKCSAFAPARGDATGRARVWRRPASGQRSRINNALLITPCNLEAALKK